MQLKMSMSKVIILLSLLGIATISVVSIASATSVVSGSNFTLGIAWTGMILSAYEGSILGIMVSILGYWGALAAIALAPPTGGASIAVAL